MVYELNEAMIDAHSTWHWHIHVDTSNLKNSSSIEPSFIRVK